MREDECIQRFGGKNRRKEIIRKTCLYVSGRTILKWILEKTRWDGMYWINLAHDRDQWRALVNTVVNLMIK
jgi:hypothetical protein